MMLSRFPLEFPLHLTSFVLASLASVVAVYLIPVAGKAKAWLLLSAAFVLIACDRVLETISYSGMFLDVATYEVVRDYSDVLISLCLFLGVIFIRALFVERRSDRRKLEQHLEELQRFQQVSVGRELRMKELYEENQALKARLEKTND